MRRGLKKMLVVLTVASAILGLAGCNSSSAADEADTLEQDYCQSVADFLLNDWNTMSEEDLSNLAGSDVDDIQKQIDMVESMGSSFPLTAEAFVSACAGYVSSMEDLGAYVSTDEYGLPEQSGEDTVFVTKLQYENRKADLTLIFNEQGIVESVTLDPVYSIGEILQKAGMNTVLGMGTVFAVLIFLSFLIYCFKYVPAVIAFFAAVFAPVRALLQSLFSAGKRKKEEALEKPAASGPVSERRAAPAKKKTGAAKMPVREEELMDEGELVAAITAAICAYRGNTGDDFVVRSIRRADSAKWKRA